MANFDGFRERFDSSEDNRPTYNQGAYDDGFKARLDEHSIDSHPTVEQSSEFYVSSWRAGWTDADADIQQGKLDELAKSLQN